MLLNFDIEIVNVQCVAPSSATSRFTAKVFCVAIFKRPPASAAARRFWAIFIKIGFFRKLVKIAFWGGFGSIWAPESSSAWKTGIRTSVQTSISSFFENHFLEKSGFGYFFTFERYFEAWEHQNRTQLEKISRGSYFQNFWPDGKLIGARRRSKLANNAVVPLVTASRVFVFKALFFFYF